MLRRQHIDRMFKRHWVTQGQRTVRDTNVEAALTARGLKVSDPNEFLAKINRRERIE